MRRPDSWPTRNRPGRSGINRDRLDEKDDGRSSGAWRSRPAARRYYLNPGIGVIIRFKRRRDVRSMGAARAEGKRHSRSRPQRRGVGQHRDPEPGRQCAHRIGETATGAQAPNRLPASTRFQFRGGKGIITMERRPTRYGVRSSVSRGSRTEETYGAVTA